MRSEPSVLHVDLDAFFAAVEQRDKPSLRGRPVIVGGLGARGVVATASYEARKQGVSSAMPMAHARARCRQAAFLVPRFRVYAETSDAIMDVLRSASVLVEPLSLDEAYVDLAAPDSPEPGPLDIDAVVARGRELKSKIRSTTGLIASVGAGTSKLVAKVASDLGKPDGLLVVAPGDETELLAPLPVSRLPGVGPATEERLRAMGVHTVSQLAAVDRAELVTQLGKAHGDQLWRLARADDPRPVDPSRVTRSISVEDTFERDVVGTSRLTAVVEEMAARIASRLRADGWTGRTITVKVRRHDFATLSRSATLPAPTDDTRTLARLPGGCSPRSTRATACACSASGSAGWPTGPRATCSRPILSQLRTRSLLPIGVCHPHRPGARRRRRA